MSFNRLEVAPPLGPLKPTLNVLHMTSNAISWIDEDYFVGFKRLREIHLNNNRLQTLPCLTSLQTTLQELRLSNNRLENVDGMQISGTFIMLKHLVLSGNNIISFNTSMLRNMPILSTLGLQKNRLKTLPDPRPFFNGIIMLVGNPWHCDATISWMPAMVRYGDRLFCESPPCLRGNTIKQMSK